MSIERLVRCPDDTLPAIRVVFAALPFHSRSAAMDPIERSGDRDLLSRRHSAIHGDDLAGHVARARAGQIAYQVGDIFRRSQPAHGNALLDLGFDLFRQDVVISVVMKPGATTFTVIPRVASSRAIVLLKPITPALLAE